MSNKVHEIIIIQEKCCLIKLRVYLGDIPKERSIGSVHTKLFIYN